MSRSTGGLKAPQPLTEIDPTALGALEHLAWKLKARADDFKDLVLRLEALVNDMKVESELRQAGRRRRSTSINWDRLSEDDLFALRSNMQVLVSTLKSLDDLVRWLRG